MSRVWLWRRGEQPAGNPVTGRPTPPRGQPAVAGDGYTPGCPRCNPEGKPGGGDPKCPDCGGTG